MITEQFIKQVIAGDEQGLRHFYLKHKKPFARFIRSKYPMDDETIGDLYQDAVVALVEHARKGNLNQLKAAIATYLFSIGKNMAFKRHRKAIPTVTDIDVIGQLPDLPEIDNRNERLLLIAEKISLLGESCQKLLRQFYYEGKTLDEIMLGGHYSGKDVVKSQKSRCLAQLKKLINGKYE